jgi:hypothetical protein
LTPPKGTVPPPSTLPSTAPNLPHAHPTPGYRALPSPASVLQELPPPLFPRSGEASSSTGTGTYAPAISRFQGLSQGPTGSANARRNLSRLRMLPQNRALTHPVSFTVTILFWPNVVSGPYEPRDHPTYELRATMAQFATTLKILRARHLVFDAVLPTDASNLGPALSVAISNHFSTHRLILPSQPNCTDTSYNFHNQPWVVMKACCRKGNFTAFLPETNLSGKTFDKKAVTRLSEQFVNPEPRNDNLLLVLCSFYKQYSHSLPANPFLRLAPQYGHVSGPLTMPDIDNDNPASFVELPHPCFAQRVLNGVPYSGPLRADATCLTGLCPGMTVPETSTSSQSTIPSVRQRSPVLPVGISSLFLLSI